MSPVFLEYPWIITEYPPTSKYLTSYLLNAIINSRKSSLNILAIFPHRKHRFIHSGRIINIIIISHCVQISCSFQSLASRHILYFGFYPSLIFLKFSCPMYGAIYFQNLENYYLLYKFLKKLSIFLGNKH